MKFFYWADRQSPKLAPLLDSAASNGIELVPIGMGHIQPDWEHTLFKQRSLYEAIERLDDREIVCATDGFDVFYQQGAGYIADQFASFGSDVVFSAERGYSHQYRRFKRFFDEAAGESPYPYLNAGCVIGYAGALKKLYRQDLRVNLRMITLRNRLLKNLVDTGTELYEKVFMSGAERLRDLVRWYSYKDQAHMAKCMALGRHGVTIDLDRQCKLFWCTAFEWDDIDNHCRLVEGRLENAHTGQKPACVHVPWEIKKRAVFLKLYESVYGSDAQADV